MGVFFPLLILNARPAAGKSEIVEALRQVPVRSRIERFHIGPIHAIDDFPMLWAWLEEDAILEGELHQPRLHTTPDEYFLHHDLWHLLIRRLRLEVEKHLRDRSEPHTVILEFSRGSEHGGYRAAYPHLGSRLLGQAAVLYIQVPYEESVRKNRARFDPCRPDSNLQHSLSDRKLERLYRHDDWPAFCADDPEYLHVGEASLPYVVFDNGDDVTSRGGEALYARLQESLGRLWELAQAVSGAPWGDASA